MGTGLFLREEHIYEPLPFHITSVGRFNGIPNGIVATGTPAITAAAWPVNNLAVYTPISIPTPFTVARFMVANGSNITGNVDVGLYDSAGNRLISTGTTARADASTVQYIGVTDQTFQAGHYYLALVGSSTTGTYVRSTFASASRAVLFGLLEETLGSTVLPVTMTPVRYARVEAYQYGFSQSDAI